MGAFQTLREQGLLPLAQIDAEGNMRWVGGEWGWGGEAGQGWLLAPECGVTVSFSGLAVASGAPAGAGSSMQADS